MSASLARSLVCCLLLAAAAPAHGLNLIFTVTIPADTPDGNPGDGSCNDGNGECTLRAAIQEANAVSGKDTIQFGVSALTIDLASALPPVSSPLVLVGKTTHTIEVKTTHGVATGLNLVAGSEGSAVSYLVMSGFQTAIAVTANNVELAFNHIGPNSGTGIDLGGNNVIVRLNLVTGNAVGIRLSGSGYSLWGNTVGLNAAHTVSAPNGTGVLLVNATGASIGVSGGNYISGNTGDGIRISGTSNNNSITNNLIGVLGSAGGSGVFPNNGAGIAVEATARDNRIYKNAIDRNGGLGIDLLSAAGGAGVTPNDVGDGDAGGNDLQNFPAGKAGTGFTTLRVFGGGFQVEGGLASTPGTGFTIDLYQSPACDPSGFGEGRDWITSTTVTTDGNGDAPFTFALGTAVSSGWVVTATAQRTGVGTSEFSQCSPPFLPATTTTTATSSTTTTAPSTTTTSASTTTSTSASTTTSTSTTTSSSTSISSTTTTATTTTTTRSSASSTTSTTTTSSSLPSTTSGSSSSSTSLTATTTTPTSASLPSTTSTTSTTVPAQCGNGVVEPGEVCDPAAAEFAGCCDQLFCRPKQAGTPCGLDEGCGTPLCDTGGRCRTRPDFVGSTCRSPGTLSYCDPGATCTQAPGCPTTDIESACQAVQFAYRAQRGRLKLLCTAKRGAFSRVPLKCLAAVFGDTTETRAAGTAPNAAVPASDCSGPQFAVTVTRRLLKQGRENLARAVVAKIRKQDRRYFTPGSTVCIRVTFDNGSGFLRTRNYNFEIPGAPAS